MSAGLGGLNGTLNGMQVMSQMEALQKLREEELARQAQQAASQAGAAQQAYGQAAAAPPPQLDPMAVLLPTLIGNVASVIAQDPSFRQRAQQGLEATRREQFQARAQNLQALRDNALQLAERAQRVGDLEQESKFRGKIETLNKNLELLEQKERIAAAEKAREDEQAARRELQASDQAARLALQEQEHKFRLREIGASGEQQRKTVEARKSQTTPGGVDLKALPTPFQYQSQKKSLITNLDRNVSAKDAENRITQAKSLATTRLRTELSPRQMAVRLDQFNEEMKRVKRRKLGGLFSKAKSQADTLTVAEAKEALYRNFDAEEVDAFLQEAATKRKGGGGKF